MSAPSLYGSPVAADHLPDRLLDDMRRTLAPPTLQAADRDLHHGAINGGTAPTHLLKQAAR